MQLLFTSSLKAFAVLQFDSGVLVVDGSRACGRKMFVYSGLLQNFANETVEPYFKK